MYQLRLKILGPAIVVIMMLGILGFAQPHLMLPITFAFPIVMTISMVILFFLERARKRKNSSPNNSSTQVD